jgi:hypothetical protein
MTLNIIAYLVYLLITAVITIKVGWICYRNGIHFIYGELHDMALSQTVNKLLLTGYYLVNLGYVSLMLYHWKKVGGIVDLVESISYKTGSIVLFLGGLHGINMLVIYLSRNRKTF